MYGMEHVPVGIISAFFSLGVFVSLWEVIDMVRLTLLELLGSFWSCVC